MKTCGKCGETKLVSEFTPDPGMVDGRYAWCKPCKNAQQRQRYATNLGACRTYSAQRRRRHAGVRLDDLEPALRAYNSATVCSVCSDNFSKSKKVVDHDHATGRFRGILCSRCNTSLGGFRDSPSIMLNAISYLMKHRASATSASSDDPYVLFDVESDLRASRTIRSSQQ